MIIFEGDLGVPDFQIHITINMKFNIFLIINTPLKVLMYNLIVPKCEFVIIHMYN